MIKHRSGFFGLALSLAVLSAACEDKTDVVIPPDIDPILVNVVPDAISIQVGESQQLVASVTGGEATTDRSVTWASSNTNVATVDASGNVTGVANGTSTVSATSVADVNAKDAASVTVEPGSAPPSLSIKSITTFATNIPVALNNVFGQIDITMNLEAPPGSQISTLNTYVTNGTNETLVCSQEFSSASVAALTGDEAQDQAEIICSVATNAFTGEAGVDPEATVTFENGPGYKVKAEIVGPQGTITAQVASAEMTFNNTNFIFSELTSPTHCVNSATTGLVWCEGDVKGEFLPVMFTTDVVSSITLVSSSGALATDATAADGFNITLQKASSPGASSVAAVENAAVTFTVNSLTAGGQPGPRCINPDPTLNPQPACGVTANLNVWVMAAPFRLDNVAPTVTRFDLTPGGGMPNPADSIGLGCNPTFPVPVSPNACYINETFAFGTAQTVTQTIVGPVSSQVPFFVMADAGVGSPTVSFQAGVAGTLAPVTVGGELAESVTSNTYIAEATTKDALDNTTVVYASPTGLGQASATGAQTFGVDTTAPSSGPTLGLADLSTNPVAVVPAWTVGPAIDAGVGPSGFLPNPFRVIVERHRPGNVTCFLPDNLFADNNVNCVDSNGDPLYNADDGLVDVPAGLAPAAGTEGYWHLIVHAVDAAWPGNVSADSQRTTLFDVTPPVVGGISAPASLPGGAAATFTAPLVDNVDLGAISPFLTYAGGTLFQSPSVTLGAYGFADGLVGSAAGNFAVTNFTRSIEGTTAAGRANATPNAATDVTFDVTDVAANLTSATLNISAAVTFGAGGIIPALGTAATGAPAVDSATFNPTNALHGNFVHQAANPAQVCQGGSSACGSSPPASTVLSVTMTGPNATFANPFTQVQFYYQDPLNARWYLIGTGTPAASDNTVTSTRTWTYSFTWTVTGLTDSAGNPLVNPAVNLVAVGTHASGSAIISTGTPITIDITAT
ncbi:MAG: Ig-like domain-containing protein [Longimicrobiales bacterium]